jgi:hypothetical protein
MLGDQLAEGGPFEWTRGDDALVGSVIDDFPTFGIIVSGADRLSQHGPQLAAAPQITTQDRDKTQRVQGCHGVITSAGACKWEFCTIFAINREPATHDSMP